MKKALIAILLPLLFFTFCAPREQSNKPKILVSPKGLVLSFWTSVREGAMQAGKDFDVDIVWKGPSLEINIAEQISIVEDNINKRVDAIVLAACDATALVPVVERADAAGIPVVTIDSDLNSDVRKSFIATDNVAASEKAADVLYELIGGKGEVAILPIIPGSSTTIMREKGFDQGLVKYPEMKLVAKQYSHAEVDRAMAITEDIVTAHQNLAGIFAANESATIGSAQALKSRGLAGKIKIVGFDAAPNEVQVLEEGVVDALIVQDPYKMGYMGVKTALDLINGKEVEKRIDTGVYVVTRENLHSPEIQKLINPTN